MQPISTTEGSTAKDVFLNPDSRFTEAAQLEDTAILDHVVSAFEAAHFDIDNLFDLLGYNTVSRRDHEGL